jgi:hypothetical protein
MRQPSSHVLGRTAIGAAVLLIVASCVGGSTPAPASGAGLTPAAASSAPAGQSASAPASVAASTASSIACIDPGELADNGDVVRNVMQGLVADLKAKNVAQAKADAASASAGLRRLAAFVGPVQPDAAKDFLTAANGVDSAVPQFPGGQSVVDKAQTDVDSGFTRASAATCPN